MASFFWNIFAQLPRSKRRVSDMSLPGKYYLTALQGPTPFQENQDQMPNTLRRTCLSFSEVRSEPSGVGGVCTLEAVAGAQVPHCQILKKTDSLESFEWSINVEHSTPAEHCSSRDASEHKDEVYLTAQDGVNPNSGGPVVSARTRARRSSAVTLVQLHDPSPEETYESSAEVLVASVAMYSQTPVDTDRQSRCLEHDSNKAHWVNSDATVQVQHQIVLPKVAGITAAVLSQSTRCNTQQRCPARVAATSISCGESWFVDKAAAALEVCGDNSQGSLLYILDLDLCNSIAQPLLPSLVLQTGRLSEQLVYSGFISSMEQQVSDTYGSLPQV